MLYAAFMKGANSLQLLGHMILSQATKFFDPSHLSHIYHLFELMKFQVF